MAQASLLAELQTRAAEGRPITVGLAGAGQMGTDIVVQTALMPGLKIGAISEIDLNAAFAATEMAGHEKGNVVEAGSAGAIEAAIAGGRIAVTDDLSALASAGNIDVVIDATGNPNIGAGFALQAIDHGKHIVMLNVEAEITIGRYLKQKAKDAGVVYSLAAGDEPACTMEIINFAKSLGFKIVCAGKGKNNPLNFDAVPADYEAEARRRNMNARMLVEFVDGSKTMIEMVAIANATGLVPDCPGMHGPAAGLDDLADVLCPQSAGGILSKEGCVDFSIGKGVAPGVFCIIEARHPRVLERLVDLKVGKGPYFTLYRPYHLTSLEVPLTAARAVVNNHADMEPLDRPVAEVAALAKRDLAAGEILGMIGESDYRGWAMTWTEASAEGAVPIGLAERASIIKPVRAGEMLTTANCRADASLAISRIRQELDAADGLTPIKAAG